MILKAYSANWSIFLGQTEYGIINNQTVLLSLTGGFSTDLILFNK